MVVGTQSWTGPALSRRLNVLAAVDRSFGLEEMMRFDPVDCTHAPAHDGVRDRLLTLPALLDV